MSKLVSSPKIGDKVCLDWDDHGFLRIGEICGPDPKELPDCYTVRWICDNFLEENSDKTPGTLSYWYKGRTYCAKVVDTPLFKAMQELHAIDEDLDKC